MTRGSLNLVVDTVAAALLTAMVGTGYVLWFVLPPGTNRTHWIWGVERHEWGALHFWVSVSLLAVLAVHVGLHWRWLVTGLGRRFGGAWAARAPRAAGLLVLAAAAVPLAAFAVAAHLAVRPMERPLHAASAPAAGGGDAAVAHLLVTRCAPCHAARAPAGGVRADRPESLLMEQHGVRWVQAGRAEASPLLEVVGVPSAGRPLTPPHRLTGDEVELLRTWIASLPP